VVGRAVSFMEDFKNSLSFCFPTGDSVLKFIREGKGL
jgi:hypothetical protein